MTNLPQHGLRYFEQQHCSRQWRLVLTSLADSLATLAPELQQDVLHRTGTQMADSLDVDVQPSLAALSQKINAFWHELDWGYVEIAIKQEQLYIEHYHCPVPFGRYDSHAYVLLTHVLEGFYSQVLWAQGGDAHAKVTFLQTGNPMLFGYKNQEQG